jgi:hypothetical protein
VTALKGARAAHEEGRILEIFSVVAGPIRPNIHWPYYPDLSVEDWPRLANAIERAQRRAAYSDPRVFAAFESKPPAPGLLACTGEVVNRYVRRLFLSLRQLHPCCFFSAPWASAGSDRPNRARRATLL